MRIVGNKCICFLLLFFFCLALEAKAEESPGMKTSERSVEILSLYSDGRLSVQALAGPFFSPFLVQTDEVNVNYIQTDLRLGWMLNSPSSEDSLFRGNFEAIAQIGNSIIAKGPGHYIGGVAGLLRYNFVQPRTKVVPYVQIGAGVVYADIYKNDTGHTLTGQALNFTPQGGLGVRYMAGKNWSVDLEAIFHHISNAGLNKDNLGINSGGVLLGFTYFLDSRF
jgi:lipid A 3-O-deacylase